MIQSIIDRSDVRVRQRTYICKKVTTDKKNYIRQFKRLYFWFISECNTGKFETDGICQIIHGKFVSQ